MSWVASSPSSVTWSGTGGASATWTASTVGTNAWGGVSSVLTTVDYGVDFRLLVKEQFPFLLVESRPMGIVELMAEGKP